MSVVGVPARIESASLTLIFSLTIGIIENLLSITRNKKKKHDKTLMLAKSKLDSIETLVSQALTDMEISHEEFNAIIREKQKYERMKENVRNVSEKQENIRLNSVNSKKITSLYIIYEFGVVCFFLFFFCIYKMYLIPAEGYEKARVDLLIIKKNWRNLV